MEDIDKDVETLWKELQELDIPLKDGMNNIVRINRCNTFNNLIFQYVFYLIINIHYLIFNIQNDITIFNIEYQIVNIQNHQ